MKTAETMESSERLAIIEPLSQYKIKSLPPSFYYIPDFISAEEEASILGKIPARRWITLSHRRLQAHPSVLTSSNALLASPLPLWLTDPVVKRFQHLSVFQSAKHGEPNHVLINEYRRGEGIMPHEDGSAYSGVVATVSLGGALCLDISSKSTTDDSSQGHQEDGEYHDAKEPTPRIKLPTRILQEPRSLLITVGPAYTDLLHGISPTGIDEGLGSETVANWALLGDAGLFEQSKGRNERGTRISLTYRDVLKTSNAAEKVLGYLGGRQ